MPTVDERAVELRRFFPDSAVAAILGVEQQEIADLSIDPADTVEGAPDSAVGGETGGGGFDFQGAWVAGDYPAGVVVTHGGLTYITDADTSEEPGISGAPIVDGIHTVWAKVGVNTFDTSNGSDTDGSPFQAHPDATILYLPMTHAGHVQLTLDTFDDHYVSYLAYDADFTLQGSGSSDNGIGVDPNAEEWYWMLYHDPGFDSGHDAGPVTATLALSGGATMTPPPAENPWQAFATAP